jgi:hypothetical protein
MKTAFVFLGIRINIASRARRRWLVALIYAAFAALDIHGSGLMENLPSDGCSSPPLRFWPALWAAEPTRAD